MIIVGMVIAAIIGFVLYQQGVFAPKPDISITLPNGETTGINLPKAD